MNKLEKPKLTSIKEIFCFLLTILSPLFGLGNLEFKHFIIIYSILIGLIIIYVFIKYLYCVSQFYKNYEKQFIEFNKIEKNRDALNMQFKEKQQEITKLKNIIDQYDYIFNGAVNSIQQGACNISKEEQQYLINLYNILCQDKEYIFKIKGGN